MKKQKFFRSKKYTENITGYTLLSPFLIIFLIFMIVPFFWSIGLSFTEGSVLSPKEFVGFKNYIELFQQKGFLGSILTTFKYMAIMIPSVFVVSLTVALILYSVKKKFVENLFRTFIIIPYLTSSIIASLTWSLMLHPNYGIVNKIIGFLNIPDIRWFGDPRIVLFTVAIVELWRGSGFFILLVFAGLQSIDTELIEASRIDGAGYFQTVLHIIIPGLRPILTLMLVMLSIWQLQVFDAIYILTRGGPAGSSTTAVWYIYQNIFSYGKVGRGSTMAVFLIFVIACITAINLILTRFREQTL